MNPIASTTVIGALCAHLPARLVQASEAARGAGSGAQAALYTSAACSSHSPGGL